MINQQDLKSAIRQKNFSWENAETSLSRMSEEEQKAHLGLLVDEQELEATAQATAAADRAFKFREREIAIPTAIDWRNNNGNWTTAIKDQGNCGSCVAFGTAATLEARLKIATNSPGAVPDLSEAHLFYCGCGNCCSNGWNFAPALDFCKNTGVGQESAFPYTPGNQPCKTGVTPYLKVTSWSAVLATADRKRILAEKGPVVAGMAVYQDFFSYKSGVYRHTQGSLAGYHAISVVGYDDNQQCWIAKNSWGSGWGDAGWFRIGYGDSGIDSSFAFYDAAVARVIPPTDICRTYAPYLSRVILVARTNPMLRACLRYYVCGMGARPLCLTQYMAVVQAVVAIVRRCPEYRAPFCRALA